MKKKLTKKADKTVEVKEEVQKFNIDKFRKDMNKTFGENALMLGSEIIPYAQQKISTGSLSLDIALGGGVPIGRFLHMSGLESSFKSTTAYHIIANAQKMTKEVVIKDQDKKDKNKVNIRKEKHAMSAILINVETGTFTKEYAEQLGVDADSLLICQCAGMEEACDILLEAQLKGIDLGVIDSIESLIPTKEYESNMNESVQMGIKPRLSGEFLRKFSANNNKLLREGQQPFTLIGLNQLRDKIGSYRTPLFAPGGRAWNFMASIEVMMRKGDIITQGTGVNKHAIGQTIKFKVNKNKVGVPLRTGSFDIYFDEGGPVQPGFVDVYKEVVLEGISYGIIEKSGAWFSYGDIKVNGAAAFEEEVKADKYLFRELWDKILQVAKEDTEVLVIEDE